MLIISMSFDIEIFLFQSWNIAKFIWALQVLYVFPIYSCLNSEQLPNVLKFSSLDANLCECRALSVFFFPLKSNLDKINSKNNGRKDLQDCILLKYILWISF